MWKLITGLQGVDLFCLDSNHIKFRGKIRQNEIQLIVPSYFSTNFLRLFCKALRQWLLHQIVMYGLASFAGWAKYFLCRQKVFKNLVSKKTRLVRCTSVWPRLHPIFMFPIFYLSFVEWFENRIFEPSNSFCSHYQNKLKISEIPPC